MNRLDLFKSIAMFIVIVFVVVNKMSDFAGKKHSEQKNKGFNDEIARIGGKVVDVRQADNRTYMRVRPENGPEFWLTTREMNAQIGDQISFEFSVPRHDYYSKELGRNFSEIYVVSYIEQTKIDHDIS